MNKKYKVLFYYTEYGATIVSANSKAKALKKVKDILTENGVSDFVYDCKDRDYQAVIAEEIRS